MEYCKKVGYRNGTSEMYVVGEESGQVVNEQDLVESLAPLAMVFGRVVVWEDEHRGKIKYKFKTHRQALSFVQQLVGWSKWVDEIKPLSVFKKATVLKKVVVDRPIPTNLELLSKYFPPELIKHWHGSK